MMKRSSGWSAAEDARLMELADAAQAERLPLSTVFAELASELGRQPNSMRNRYYARRRELRRPSTAFVPFTEAESDALVREVLRAQARGESVRACTLRLANGDSALSLRYQNKYRALLRSHPTSVSAAMRELEACGEATFDPYRARPGRVGRPRKSEPELKPLVEDLARALYETLLDLAKRA